MPKKDNARSSDKSKKSKRDGSIDKCVSPSAIDTLHEESKSPEPAKQVIINDDILNLAISSESLMKMRQLVPLTTPDSLNKLSASREICIKKLKPLPSTTKNIKRVNVAKPASPDAPLEMYSSKYVVPFDKMTLSNVIGDLNEYIESALEAGDITLEEAHAMKRQNSSRLLMQSSTKTNLKNKDSTEENAAFYGTNALQNWENKLKQQQNQKHHIAKILQKPVTELAMNRDDNYRKKVELRDMINRTFHTIDPGRQFKGSEFWNQQEEVCDEERRIHVTLGQTEQGYPPAIEHVGISNKIKQEKGYTSNKVSDDSFKPWCENPYLHFRQNQLHNAMKELDPHTPEIDELAVIGSSKISTDENSVDLEKDCIQINSEQISSSSNPLDDIPDVHPDLYNPYPTMDFCGYKAYWNGSPCDRDGQIEYEHRLNFEMDIGEKIEKNIEIKNCGNTVIYYWWEPIKTENPFGFGLNSIGSQNHSKFYFDLREGVVMPKGDIKTININFKSSNSGIFTEKWRLKTKPVLNGGASMIMVLHGVVFQTDKKRDHGENLKKEINHRVAQNISSKIIENILSNIRSPERPSTPPHEYIIDEEIFLHLNPNLHFHNDVFVQMREMYVQVSHILSKEDSNWNLSVEALRKLLLELPLNNEKRAAYLKLLNEFIDKLSFSSFSLPKVNIVPTCRQIICDMIDEMSSTGMDLRKSLSLPLEYSFDESHDKKSIASQRSNLSELKKSAQSRDGNKQKSAKSPLRGSKTSKNIVQATSEDIDSSAHQLLIAKYKNKLYTQTHKIFSEHLNHLNIVLEEMENEQ